jgi:hypothetical protein
MINYEPAVLYYLNKYKIENDSINLYSELCSVDNPDESKLCVHKKYNVLLEITTTHHPGFAEYYTFISVSQCVKEYRIYTIDEILK